MKQISLITNYQIIKALFLAFALLLGACSKQEESPEGVLRALLDEAETAIEARDLNAASSHLSDSYKDGYGRDRRELQRIMMGYFLRHKSIHIISRIERIQIDQQRASVLLYAAMAGSSAQQLPINQWRADLMRIELMFQQEDDGEWRVGSAVWRRAKREDFLE